MTSELKPWKTELVGKNKHSVFSRCYQCQTWGINFPLDDKCGNCNTETPTTTFYDEDTIDNFLKSHESQIKREVIEKVIKGVEEAMDKADYPDDVSNCVQEYLNNLLKEQP